MKTLTAKLAVAALLVAGAAQAGQNLGISVLATGAAVWHANDAFQNASATWYANQSAQQNKTRLQKAKAFVTNAKGYALPAAQVVSAGLLAARATNCPCTPNFVAAHVSQEQAVIFLTALTVGKKLYNDRTDAQVAADAAVVTAVETSAAQAAANAQAAAQSASTDSKAKAAVSKK
jgi:hypothetical protein